MVRCDPRIGIYMSCCLLYRGNIKNSNEIKKAINFLKDKKSIRFVNFIKTGFKVIVILIFIADCRYKKQVIFLLFQVYRASN